MGAKVAVQTQKWGGKVTLGTLKAVLCHKTVVEKVYSNIQEYRGEE